MMYEVILRTKKCGAEWHTDSFLPGLIPDRVFDMMECSFVENEIGLCDKCDVRGARCHVFEVIAKHEDDEDYYGRKMCPVLFNDVVKPKWKVSDVV